MRACLLTLLLAAAALSCARPQVDPSADPTRDPAAPEPWLCSAGEERCSGSAHQRCVPEGEFLRVEARDCAAEGLVCVTDLWCVECRPDTRACNDDDTAVVVCGGDGSGWSVVEPCDIAAGEVCWDAACRDSCEVAAERRSNVGCEYWAADLDNASITNGLDASIQQLGVVVSNVGASPARVTVEIDRAAPGEPPDLEVIEEATIDPGDLEVFDDLPRREVDGTPPDAADWWCNPLETGHDCLTTNSALSRAAFRITSDRPVIAYQYQPLDNAEVFSNDASMLLPATALGDGYVVMGWPQTIADTDDPATDANRHLRSFLTLVGTRPGTRVSITLTTDTVAGDGLPAYSAGEAVEMTLDPFDVLNLETGAFLADFTGTVIEADGPVVVFSGSEAADVPFYETRSERLCCADHLEEQLPPRDTLGRAFFATPMPSRTRALVAAGGPVAQVDEPEYFRILAVDPGVTTVWVGLPGRDRDPIALEQNQHVTLEATTDFAVVSDKRIALGQFVAGQEAVGIPDRAPGGDPAFLHVPPVEQYRDRYVFLTPSLYAFDFVVVVAPRGATLRLDGEPLPDSCTVSTADGELHAADAPTDFVVYRCPLSSPIVEEPPGGIGDWPVYPGHQSDGVHDLVADQPVGLLVYGFDSFVSYALAGGTELRTLE
jgi:hypothetical protein